MRVCRGGNDGIEGVGRRKWWDCGRLQAEIMRLKMSREGHDGIEGVYKGNDDIEGVQCGK